MVFHLQVFAWITFQPFLVTLFTVAVVDVLVAVVLVAILIIIAATRALVGTVCGLFDEVIDCGCGLEFF